MGRGKHAAVAVGDGPIDGPWALPDGWRWERLGDIAEVNPRTDFTSLASGQEVTFLPMAAIAEESGRVNISATRQIEAVAKGFTRFRTGDVLFAKITPCMENGKTAVVPTIPWGVGAGSTEFHVIRAQELDPKFVFYFLVQRVFREKARRNMSGSAGQLRVPTEYLRAALFPVPELSEQRRIVARVDALFAEIDEGERALAEARAGVETYRKALLKAAVTGELTADWRARNPPKETGQDLLRRILTDRRARWEANPKNKGKRYVEPAAPDIDRLPELPDEWCWAALAQLGDFGRGKSKHRPRNDPSLFGGPYPFIQTGIVAGSSGDIIKYDQTYTAKGLAQSKLWRAGTLCITIAANIAKTAVLTFDACFPDSIVGLTCDGGVVPQFVELFIRTVQADLERYAPATAQKNINLETLYALAVPLPPTAEQDQIVKLSRSDDGLVVVANDEGFVTGLSSLRQSILAAAFRGELNQ